MLNLTITRCVHLSMMLKSGAKLRLFVGMAKCCGRFFIFLPRGTGFRNVCVFSVLLRLRGLEPAWAALCLPSLRVPAAATVRKFRAAKAGVPSRLAEPHDSSGATLPRPGRCVRKPRCAALERSLLRG